MSLKVVIALSTIITSASCSFAQDQFARTVNVSILIRDMNNIPISQLPVVVLSARDIQTAVLDDQGNAAVQIVVDERDPVLALQLGEHEHFGDIPEDQRQARIQRTRDVLSSFTVANLYYTTLNPTDTTHFFDIHIPDTGIVRAKFIPLSDNVLSLLVLTRQDIAPGRSPLVKWRATIERGVQLDIGGIAVNEQAGIMVSDGSGFWHYIDVPALPAGVQLNLGDVFVDPPAEDTLTSFRIAIGPSGSDLDDYNVIIPGNAAVIPPAKSPDLTNLDTSTSFVSLDGTILAHLPRLGVSLPAYGASSNTVVNKRPMSVDPADDADGVIQHPRLPLGQYFVIPGPVWGELTLRVYDLVHAGRGQELLDASVPVITVSATIEHVYEIETGLVVDAIMSVNLSPPGNGGGGTILHGVASQPTRAEPSNKSPVPR